jgi:hypothetical protein
VSVSDAFVREFFVDFLESRFVDGSLTVDEYHAGCAALHTVEFARIAESLRMASPSPVEVPGYRIRYAIYEELCRKLYFGLPAFFSRNRMRSPNRKR